MSYSILKIARSFAIGLLLTAVVLLMVNPKAENNLPKGFSTPIIAFEFIQNKQQILDFFKVNDAAAYQSRMLTGNAVDYLFMIIYSSFLACIALIIKQETAAKTMYVAIFLCILMCLGDALENYQIYQLVTKHRDSLDLVKSISSTNFYDIHITLLKFFTWLKWFSIAGTFLLFTPYYFKGKLFYKIIGICCMVSFLLSIAALLNHGILNELFANSVVFLFLLLIVFCFSYKPNIISH